MNTQMGFSILFYINTDAFLSLILYMSFVPVCAPQSLLTLRYTTHIKKGNLPLLNDSLKRHKQQKPIHC